MTTSTLERHRAHEHETKRPAFSTERTVEDYAKHVEDTRPDVLKHAQRTKSLVVSVAGSLMPKEAIELSLVHDVFDRFWQKHGPKYEEKRAGLAKAVLLDMFTDPDNSISYEQMDYASCILHDMVEVERESGEHRRKMAGESGRDPEVISMLSDKYVDEIPKEVWGATEPYIMFDHMHSFLKKTNIEALVIKACELVDNMREPSSLRQSAWLQDVLEAESFYAPILEVIGFDGLASILRGEAHRIRLEKQGRGDLVEDARKMLEGVEQQGIDSIASDVFGSWYAGDHSYAVGEDVVRGETPVFVGDGRITIGTSEVDLKFRIKTVGSLADKLKRYDGEAPRDVVGFTVVSKDVQESARHFADFIAERMSELESTVARGKKKPFYVAGSTEFVDEVCSILEARGLEEGVDYQAERQSPKDIEDEGYRKLNVAKATLMTDQGVPVEVQFLTEEERREARTGEVAHIIYKYIKSFGANMTATQKKAMVLQAVALLKEMHARRSYLNPDKLEVNKRSLAGGKSVLFDLAA